MLVSHCWNENFFFESVLFLAMCIAYLRDYYLYVLFFFNKICDYFPRGFSLWAKTKKSEGAIYTKVFLPKEACRIHSQKNIEKLHGQGIDLIHIARNGLIPLNAYSREKKMNNVRKQRECVEQEQNEA